ncbi:MAG: penicillin-insensitive murein endopeptidase [Myxococcales bacterium]|nr:penicillin-insensitive murein endopeptidase [Myxococcales bacterium]
MYDGTRKRLRIRRHRPWWTILLALGLGWPTLAAAAEPQDAQESEVEDGDGETTPALVTAGDRPTRAPAHADCGHRMPLYEHTVERGEHLGTIAGRYGVRSHELVALNPQLANPNLIRPGDVIRVCPEIFPRRIDRVEHVVAAGETLGSIAAQHGLTVGELVEQQHGAIRDPNLVRVGQRLVIEKDGGLVADFLPPPPRADKRRSGGGKRADVSRRLPASEHLRIKHPHLAYGTPKTIELVEQAVAQYKRHHRGAPKVVVGDISRKGGGALRPHVSHQTGRDIDLGYVLRGSEGARSIDVPRTWALLRAFLDTQQVVYVFVDYRIQQQLYEHAKAQGVSSRELDELFQYPHGRGRAHGIIRHWPSHQWHFHVRFRS